jgi:hypothetical protein
MVSEVVLEVAGEGGSITLRKQEASTGLRFWVETDETGIIDDLIEDDQEGVSTGSRLDPVSSLAEGLEQLDRYPWFRLSPVSVNREYREAVLAAVRKRVGLKSDDSTAILNRWSAVAGGAMSPNPPRISDASLIIEVVNKTRTEEWVAARILEAERRETSLPTREEFWKQLVLALLTSQQRSTKGSELDLFAQREPFPIALQIYEGKTDDEIKAALKSFRFGRRITEYLRENYETLFGGDGIWGEVCRVMEGLVEQKRAEPTIASKYREREAAHLLSDRLRGIGPKQSRNLLQELGLTRYEIPLDSRVAGWLGENLGWNIPSSDLSDLEVYEFWLDRLQSVCEEAGVLPTVFDAAASDVGKTMPSRKGATTRTGYVNKNGQVVVRNTRLPGTDHLQWVYQLGCSQCGYIYGANGSDIFQRKCPVCQGGATATSFDS